ncbi:MAG: hypothetical protein DMF69_13590 [Acidobacteria bacterium]|nr:MAG: hypothetical protein DMF69_13590 [Acidobacteriota bacterium]
MPTIATPQVAVEAMQLNQRLRTLPDRVVADQTLAELQQQITSLEETTREIERKTEQAIQSGAIFTELQESELDWEALNKQVKSLSEILITHATALENEVQSLRIEESLWSATSEQIKTQESPAELSELTGKALADISAASTSAEERRSRIVALQQSVAKQGVIISTETERVKKAKAESQRSLLVPDRPPLWKVQFQPEQGISPLLRSSFVEDVARLKTFISAKATVLLGIAFLTLGVLGFFLRLRRAPQTETSESNLKKRTLMLQRPIALALLVFVLAMMLLFFDAPNVVLALVYLIGLVPVLRLLKPHLTKTTQRMLVALIVSVLIWHLIKLIHFPIWIKRDLIAVFNLVVVGSFGWWLRQAYRDNLNRQRGLTLTLVATAAAIVLLVLAFFANLSGYVGLSNLLTLGTLTSSYRAVSLYTVFAVGSLLISLIPTKTTQPLSSAGTDHDRLTRRLTFALGVTLFFVWLHTALKLFAVLEPLLAAIRTALNYQIEVGSASFKVSNIGSFIFVLIVGYLIASVTRALLGEVILPRLKLEYGLPNAIATITHYVVLVMVFFLAIAAAGVELSKFTILTGAIGVGLGFGLQNVVNNFVSGLILLFERPVRIGDFLEIGGATGQVSKIGVRSSTLHAIDGSDLIIPNATLISERVTNWTLSSTRRQIFLNIPVAYGNDPTEVRDLLRNTVSAHPDVLKVPNPKAFFLGFGDSALNFEVRFWAARPQVVLDLKSEVALSIAAALTKAGMKVPMPQRALHITRSDLDASAAASTKDEVEIETEA